jgi:hypothetical protein
VSSSRTTVAGTDLSAQARPGSTQRSKAPAGRDYGVVPGDSAKSAIEEYMRQVLNTPHNTHFRYANAPEKGSHGGWSDTPVAYGYVMCVWISAQGSEGANTGERLNFFLIRNDQVVRAAANANWLCKPYLQ